MPLKYLQVIALAGVFLLQYLFEHVSPQQKKINDWRNERFNILIGVINVVLTFLPAALVVKLVTFISEKNLGIFQMIHLPLWAEIILAVIILDAWMYAWHRLNHVIPWLWKFHSFHHKDTKMNTTTALRFHIVELLLSYPGKALVCLVAGVSYIPLLIFEVLFSTAVIIHHSNIFITEPTDKFYRVLFSSPLMHRIHHSIRIDETNSNYGGIFSFWDRLFKTWKQRPKGELVFGVSNE